jgi:hypothetical protein
MDLLRPIKSALDSPEVHQHPAKTNLIFKSPTFLLLCARRHNDDVALPSFLVCSGAYTRACVAVEGRVREVLDLGVANLLLWVHHEDIARDRIHDERVGNGCADIASADNGYLGGEFGVGRHGDVRDVSGLYGCSRSSQRVTAAQVNAFSIFVSVNDVIVMTLMQWQAEDAAECMSSELVYEPRCLTPVEAMIVCRKCVHCH